MRGGRVQPDVQVPAIQEIVHRTVPVGIDEAVQLADREPNHRAEFRLIGLQPTVVRLVVGIETGHQFDIAAGIVRQAFVGLQAAGVVAVGPILHTGHHIVVAHPCGTCLQAMVIPAEVVLLRIPGEEGNRRAGVHPAADVQPRVIVPVERAVRDGPGGHAVLAVIGHVFHARREDDLVVLVAADRRVRPEEERVGDFRGVPGNDRHLHQGGIGVHRIADQDVGALKTLLGIDPDRLAAVGILLDPVLHVLHRGGTVVVGIAPGQGAGAPVTHHADQRRLDNGVVVEPVVAVRLVVGIVDAAALLRGDSEADIVVFDKDHVIVHVLLVHRQAVVEGIRVHAPLHALVVGPFIKTGHRVRCGRDIGRYRLRPLRHLQLGGGLRAEEQKAGERKAEQNTRFHFLRV